jgi:hypothetical protein
MEKYLKIMALRENAREFEGGMGPVNRVSPTIKTILVFPKGKPHAFW